MPSYPIDSDTIGKELVVFEVPEGVEQVKIIPLSDNAEFTYLDTEYSFENVGDDTYGMFTLSTTENASEQNSEFEIIGDSRELTEIRIVSAPSVTQFTYKDVVSTAGLRVVAKYSDGSEKDVTNEVRVTGFDTGSIGSRTATVEFEGKTATFGYTVKYAWWQWIIRIVLFGWLWY